MTDFVINFTYVIFNLMPYDLRKTKFLAYMESIVTVLQNINDSFALWEADNTEFLKYTSQVIYLEKRLNDLYDNTLRRIYITNVSYDSEVYLFNDSEGRQETYIFNVAENRENEYIRNNSETLSTVNFVVNVPTGVSTDIIISDTVNLYKLAGRQFSINRF